MKAMTDASARIPAFFPFSLFTVPVSSFLFPRFYGCYLRRTRDRIFVRWDKISRKDSSARDIGSLLCYMSLQPSVGGSRKWRVKDIAVGRYTGAFRTLPGAAGGEAYFSQVVRAGYESCGRAETAAGKGQERLQICPGHRGMLCFISFSISVYISVSYIFQYERSYIIRRWRYGRTYPIAYALPVDVRIL